jgi:hypothetical protein
MCAERGFELPGVEAALKARRLPSYIASSSLHKQLLIRASGRDVNEQWLDFLEDDGRLLADDEYRWALRMGQPIWSPFTD